MAVNKTYWKWHDCVWLSLAAPIVRSSRPLCSLRQFGLHWLPKWDIIIGYILPGVIRDCCFIYVDILPNFSRCHRVCLTIYQTQSEHCLPFWIDHVLQASTLGQCASAEVPVRVQCSLSERAPLCLWSECFGMELHLFGHRPNKAEPTQHFNGWVALLTNQQPWMVSHHWVQSILTYALHYALHMPCL